MKNRPDPVMFAKLSYYLALASSGILLVSVVLALVRISAGPFLWLALPTSAAGTFLAWAARSDFRARPGPDEAAQQARTGWRVNLLALIVMLLMVVVVIIVRASGLLSSVLMGRV